MFRMRHCVSFGTLLVTPLSSAVCSRRFGITPGLSNCKQTMATADVTVYVPVQMRTSLWMSMLGCTVTGSNTEAQQTNALHLKCCQEG
jgi:hypothetical protein